MEISEPEIHPDYNFLKTAQKGLELIAGSIPLAILGVFFGIPVLLYASYQEVTRKPLESSLLIEDPLRMYR